MKARGLYKLLERIDYALKFKEDMNSKSSLWDYIVSDKLKLKSYSMENLKVDIECLKNFDADIWCKDFYGLSIHESISAIAVPTGQKLRSVRNLIKENELW